jgi:hypothetical protein
VIAALRSAQEPQITVKLASERILIAGIQPSCRASDASTMPAEQHSNIRTLKAIDFIPDNRAWMNGMEKANISRKANSCERSARLTVSFMMPPDRSLAANPTVSYTLAYPS